MEFTSAPPSAEEPNPLAGISFTLDGEQFHCRGKVKLFEMSNSARLARDGDVNAQAALFAESLMMALGTEEFDRFQAHVRDHDTPDDTIIAIAEWINKQAEERAAREAGRPTRQRPPSSSGPQDPAERMSRVISLAGGDVTVLRPGDDGFMDKMPDDPDAPPAGLKRSPAKRGGKSATGRRAG
jgi:hypothetical protein